jgi:uncharacterized protein YecT (DUF1311 family)
LALAAIIPGLLLAQESPEYLKCNEKATAQPELNACAADEAARVDAELNRIYRELLAKAKDDAVAVEKIKKFQRAWIAYRDACLDASFPAEDKQAEYGLLGAKLTRRQVEVLKELMADR